MATKRFVLSTVGISPLLNALDSTEGAWRQKFNQATNAARLPDDVEAKAQELAQRVTARLRAGDVVVNRKLSAELNGIYGLYDDKLPTGGSGDIPGSGGGFNTGADKRAGFGNTSSRNGFFEP